MHDYSETIMDTELSFFGVILYRRSAAAQLRQHRNQN